MSPNRNLWLCRRFCLMRFPRRLRSPIPRPNSVALSARWELTTAASASTASGPRKEVQRRYGGCSAWRRSTTKPPVIRRFVGADDGNRTRVFSLGSRFVAPAGFVPVWWFLGEQEKAFPRRCATPEPVAHRVAGLGGPARRRWRPAGHGQRAWDRVTGRQSCPS